MAKEPKRVTARWIKGKEFAAETGSGHLITMDARRQDGGDDRGANPMELLLTAMAGCTGIDLIDILQKKRQAVSGLEIRVEGTRADDYPKVYTDIQVTYVVRGKDVSSKAVEDAIHLSETKYCSASIMLGKTAKITTRYQVLPE